MRFFPNPFKDYVVGEPIHQQDEKWLQSVLSSVDIITKKMPPTLQNCDGGLYVGAAGIAYMFYKLSTMEQLADHKQGLLQNAGHYCEIALKYIEKKHSRDPPSSFILGAAGVFMVASLIYQEFGDQRRSQHFQQLYSKLAGNCVPVNFLKCGSDELFVGRSGYLLGAFLLNKKFGQVVSHEDLFAVFNSIIKSGREYSQRRKLKCPLMFSYYETEYLGAAHGISAILMVLLYFPDFIKADPRIEKDVRESIDFILTLKQANGNYPPAMDEVGDRNQRPEKEELVHWCHGAPGVVYMLAKAYLLWKDDRYLQACIECGDITWQKGLLKKGPGICHGVAGSGYVHLLLYRLTGDAKYFYRAQKFAEFLSTDEFRRARVPDSPYSLYEGQAGTVCFLADLLNPQQAAFPFFDVFV